MTLVPEELEHPADEAAADEPAAVARILAVDDDPNNLKAIQSMLDGVADEIVFARSGREALRHILHMDFALILMDVLMPGFDGYETAAMIRNRKRSSRIPIIFLTAADRDDLQMFRGYTAGAVDFVFKPIEPFILRSKVAIFVDLHRKTQEVLLKAEQEKRLLVDNARAKDEKLRIERELRRSEERQALIMRSLPVAFYSAPATDAVQSRQFVGTGLMTITGWRESDDESGAISWIDKVHPDDRERVAGAFRELGDSKISMDIDYRVRCADGSYCAVLDHAVLTVREQGYPREVVGSLLDITERVGLQEQLIQAQKMEAVGRLTGGIAHDFNNVLHVIVSSLDRLRRRVIDNPDALKTADMALQGALRCAELTRRLLSFSRKQPIIRQVVDLNDIVRSVEAMLRRLIGNHIQLKFDCAPHLWMTETDPAQIESAIINLAVNARDAMPNGGLLTISTANSYERGRGSGGAEGEFVTVTVTDTGCGIAPEVLNKIFEPFFTTKMAGYGTGLGLSIIYNYLQQTGGNIEVLSEVGQGTSVRMLLPRSQPAAVKHERSSRNESASRGSGELVLVVEDDEVVRSQTVIALSDIGYDVIEAENAKMALELLDSQSEIRLLFTDVAMPGELNGFELAAAAMRRWPQLKVLFTSGNPDFASGRKQTPGSDHLLLRKPYRSHELARAVQEALQRDASVYLDG